MTWYSELLKDPRWQRRRLEVLGAKDFTCDHCQATDRTLHVHHMYYQRGYKPWEYPDEALRVLCEYCHEFYGKAQLDLAYATSPLSITAIEMLTGLAKAIRIIETSGRQQFPANNEKIGAVLFLDEPLSAFLGRLDGDTLDNDKHRDELKERWVARLGRLLDVSPP